MQAQTMQKFKLLSKRTRAEVKVNDVMIGLNSMIDQNQEKDLSLKRLENISIMGKTGHLRKYCWHLKKEQIEDKDQKNDDEMDTIVVVTYEEIVVLSVEE